MTCKYTKQRSVRIWDIGGQRDTYVEFTSDPLLLGDGGISTTVALAEVFWARTHVRTMLMARIVKSHLRPMYNLDIVGFEWDPHKGG